MVYPVLVIHLKMSSKSALKVEKSDNFKAKKSTLKKFTFMVGVVGALALLIPGLALSNIWPGKKFTGPKFFRPEAYIQSCLTLLSGQLKITDYAILCLREVIKKKL